MIEPVLAGEIGEVLHSAELAIAQERAVVVHAQQRVSTVSRLRFHTQGSNCEYATQPAHSTLFETSPEPSTRCRSSLSRQTLRRKVLAMGAKNRGYGSARFARREPASRRARNAPPE